MRTLAIGLLLVTSAFGQRMGHGGGIRGGVSHGGFSGGRVHGGIGRGGFVTGGVRWGHRNIGFAGRQSFFRGFGYPGSYPVPLGVTYGVPHGYPFGGFYSAPDMYGYGYGYGYAQAPNVTVIPIPASQPAGPSVVIYGERPRQAEVRESVEPVAPKLTTVEPGPTGPTLYLIALKDQTIWAAETYWVEAGTLHFVTRQHERKQAPMTRLDRDLTEQLNRERRVEFRLP